jgi:hypothetical protein
MHAVVVTVTLADRDAATEEVQQQVVPAASGAPGFVAGYWIALPGDKGVAVVVLDSEASAQAFAATVVPPPGSAATLVSAEVGEVIGHA